MFVELEVYNLPLALQIRNDLGPFHLFTNHISNKVFHLPLFHSSCLAMARAIGSLRYLGKRTDRRAFSISHKYTQVSPCMTFGEASMLIPLVCCSGHIVKVVQKPTPRCAQGNELVCQKVMKKTDPTCKH